MSPISSDTIMIRFSFRTTRPSDTVPIIGSGFQQAPHRDTSNVDNPHTRLMALPVVAIVGRPNVGKSALFNRILGERRAIVDPMAGLTRDRLYAESEWQGRKFVIVDTAGLVLGKDRDEVPAQRELRRRMAALHGTGSGDRLDAVVEKLPPPKPEVVDDKLAGRVAILGRPNVGKSSLVNALIGDARSLVTAVPGTTRDPVDTTVTFQGK